MPHSLCIIPGAAHNRELEARANGRVPHGLGEAQRAEQRVLPARARDTEQGRRADARVPRAGLDQGQRGHIVQAGRNQDTARVS